MKTERAEIDMAKIRVTADFPGLLFTVGTVLTFYWGIPELRFPVPIAIAAGCVIAIVLHFIHHEDRSASRIFPGIMK
jgi:hypothetical protein